MHSGLELFYAGAVFLSMFIFAFSLSYFKVPIIVSFMLAGLTGRMILPDEVSTLFSLLEHSAIVLLFFFIGLEYSFERLVGMRRVILPGFVDLVLNFLPAFAVAYLFTKDLFVSLIVGAILYPSSTAITAKLLIDYKRLVNPEAELLIGVLIFEDLVSIFLISALTAFAYEGKVDPLGMLKALILVLLVFLVFFLLRKPAGMASQMVERKVDESLVVFLVLGMLLLSAFGGISLGISEALVAFMLGVLVPEESKLYQLIEKSLSDLKELAVGIFFFMFTFKGKLSFDFEPFLFVLLLLVGVASKLLSTYWAGSLYGLSSRASFRASLSFIQRGEFSVVFASFSEKTQSLAFLLVLTTAILGSYAFVLAPKITQKMFSQKRHA
ncbi:MAG: cation:proton antiporter [Aquificota bacterium]|nr:MAG: cation:proton antiporter [Aquificota bacterium]